MYPGRVNNWNLGWKDTLILFCRSWQATEPKCSGGSFAIFCTSYDVSLFAYFLARHKCFGLCCSVFSLISECRLVNFSSNVFKNGYSLRLPALVCFSVSWCSIFFRDFICQCFYAADNWIRSDGDNRPCCHHYPGW